MLRLFFALQPTSAQAEELLTRTAPLVAQLHAQPVTADNLHATLCFLGAVAPEKLELVRAAAAQVRGRTAELSFDALDYWAKPRILCAIADDSRGEVAALLAGELSKAMGAAGLAPDIKPFRAHLTLARKVRAAVATTLEWPQATPPIEVRCDRFVLMQSRREPSGSIYSVVDSWPLDGDESR